jgi:hypothetical protein
MATYNSVARGQLCSPSDNTAILYYICLVDIPTSWGRPKFDAGTFESGTLTYTADIAFPTVAGADPGNAFVTYLLPLYTQQSGRINDLVVQGNTPNGVKKTGLVNNSKPIIRFTEPTAYETVTPLEARTFVIQSGSDTNNYYAGVFVLTPAVKPGVVYATSFKSMTADKTDSAKLICELQTLSTGTANQVTVFGCVPASKDQFTKAKVKDPNGSEGTAVNFDYTTAITL